jgi:hypothetical protein
MANYFSKTRNTELSVVKHIEEQIAQNWSGITVVKSFVKAYDYNVPVICVRMLNTDTFRKEIGADSIRQRTSFIIDIFAKSDGQRIDLADFVVNALKGGCKYYNFSHASGNSESLSTVESGRITLLTFDTDERVDFGDSSDEHDKFRHSISFTMEKYAS